MGPKESTANPRKERKIQIWFLAGELGFCTYGRNQRQVRMEMTTGRNASPPSAVRRSTTVCFGSVVGGGSGLGADDEEGDEPSIFFLS